MKTGVFKPGWNQNFAPIPHNYHLLDERLGENQIPNWITPHCVISQNRFGQFQILSQIAQRYQIPLITVEHTCFLPTWNEDMRKQMNEMRGNINVFITQYSVTNWGFEDRGDIEVIRHAVDTNLFKPDDSIERGNYILSVANDFRGRAQVLGWDQFKRVILDKGKPVKMVGDTKGVSIAPPNVQALVKEYQQARIMVNTHNISPIPTSLLEGAACGLACVSCNTCAIGTEFFTHGKDALLYNNDSEMKEYLDLLLHDKDLCDKLGRAARQTVMEKCNIERFTMDWLTVFNKTRNL
jgi:glycosyltransferase involved in cell wall biosynthesis